MTTTAAVSEKFVTTRLGKIQVRRGGAGVPLVYLHSAMGEGDGLGLLHELAKSCDVIAPMFPGFGESEGIEQIDDMEDAVFHLLDLFDALGLRAPVVMGLSLGGWMAAELATRYPDRASKLVLVNPAGLYIKGAEIKDIFGRTPGEMARDLFADQSFPMALMMHAMDKMMEQAGGTSLEIPFEMIRPQLQTMAATARIGWDPYLHNPKLLRRLHRITAPTLVVRGAHDTLIPAAHTSTYAREIPGARLVDIADAAHMVSLERPAELAALVREFLGTEP
jgi:pimeloyl-ACP methyl ester carboxylesterase